MKVNTAELHIRKVFMQFCVERAFFCETAWRWVGLQNIQIAPIEAKA